MKFHWLPKKSIIALLWRSGLYFTVLALLGARASSNPRPSWWIRSFIIIKYLSILYFSSDPSKTSQEVSYSLKARSKVKRDGGIQESCYRLTQAMVQVWPWLGPSSNLLSHSTKQCPFQSICQVQRVRTFPTRQRFQIKSTCLDKVDFLLQFHWTVSARLGNVIHYLTVLGSLNLSLWRRSSGTVSLNSLILNYYKAG